MKIMLKINHDLRFIFYTCVLGRIFCTKGQYMLTQPQTVGPFYKLGIGL